MLQITIPAKIDEQYNEETNEFLYSVVSKEQTLQLEHSLVSLRKWESKWCKAFLATKDKTQEELLDYIKCMTLTQNVKDSTYLSLTEENYKEIKEYIAAPMTATVFSEEKGGKKGREVVTAELIYYWMIALNIPFECQRWHLNQLITLIRVCNIKNQPSKRRSKSDILRSNAALNEARKKRLNTRG